MRESRRTYVVYNEKTGAIFECTEKYLPMWLARGFEVLEIRDECLTFDSGNVNN